MPLLHQLLHERLHGQVAMFVLFVGSYTEGDASRARVLRFGGVGFHVNHDNALAGRERGERYEREGVSESVSGNKKW